MIIDKKCADQFFEHISKIGLSLKTIRFTIEKESLSGKLPFLDLMIDRSENRIQTSVYRKPTHSNRYLNFKSHHSLENKKSVMRTLINRAFTHCTDDIKLKKELNYLRDILIENNYPLKLVEGMIADYCKKYSFLNNNDEQHNKPEFDKLNLIAIPYIKGVSEKIKYILKNHGLNTVFKKGKSIGAILSKRDNKNIIDLHDVVYNVNCNECDSVYVGTTKRQLKNRISEHKKALNKCYIKSNVADHAFSTKHDINWNNPKVKYSEKNYSARNFLESWNIEQHKYMCVPLMNDRQNIKTCIPSQYLGLLY
jgi:hypothetical protein